MSKEKAEQLLKKFVEGRCTPYEKAIVESWYISFSTEQKVSIEDEDYEGMKAEVFQSALAQKTVTSQKSYRLWPRWVAAAGIVIAISAGLMLMKTRSTPAMVTAFETRHIKAGSSKAVLVLADGTQINLGEALSRTPVLIGKTQVALDESGRLVYQASEKGGVSTDFNTISTPLGGQYEIILPDQTHVWLNASSSLRFPTRFNGDFRTVNLTGEAYFEVAHNAAQPFHVNSNGQLIEVLGTHFNVESYTGGATISTLLEGSVRINNNVLLHPGEQSVNDGLKIITQPAITGEATAWKDGKFKFTNKNIKVIMREIARWYNVEVAYQGDVDGKSFSGSVSRFDQIHKVLNLLESTNTIHFKVEGRRITVMP
ncbi:FecR family protein [Pedobacter paludis]|uniref:Anti-sigma factor n=1 Tax=Pedobacter paludis TaxID=2203212 RepID=A0A317F3B8_9SPHI|nr:FecR domain-containing protein [Pedobacter paludis]PWS33082.1 anti-sigma factor [Pedobacter paludis]